MRGNLEPHEAILEELEGSKGFAASIPVGIITCRKWRGIVGIQIAKLAPGEIAQTVCEPSSCTARLVDDEIESEADVVVDHEWRVRCQKLQEAVFAFDVEDLERTSIDGVLAVERSTGVDRELWAIEGCKHELHRVIRAFAIAAIAAIAAVAIALAGLILASGKASARDLALIAEEGPGAVDHLAVSCHRSGDGDHQCWLHRSCQGERAAAGDHAHQWQRHH